MKILVCASSRDLNPLYVEASMKLGKGLGEAGHDIIYGGGNQGLMALIAKAAGEAGSKIQGIIPDVFNKASPEVPHPHVTTELVKNLFARKEKMLFDADIAIAFPGGIGTLDELWEAAAANDIESYINPAEKMKPVIVLNTGNFFEGTRLQIQRCIDDGCVSNEKIKMFHFVDTPEEALTIVSMFAQHGFPPLSTLLK